MANETILVVDDEKEIRNLITIYLKNEGYKVLQAGDGEEGLRLLEENEVHLVVLDIMMPKVDGIHMCMKVREEKEMPIIMLSAKTQDMDKILGLTTGADDYVTKPFNPLELIARIKSQLRRYMKMNGFSIQNEDELEIGEMKINISTHKVIVEGEEVKLTPREFSILELLARNPGMVFSAEQIYEKVWNERSFQSDNTVMVHIRKVREKIEENPRKPRYIKQYGEWGIRLKKIFNPFTYIRKIRQLIEKLVKSVRKSIRIQLITTFAACALLGVFAKERTIFENANRKATVDYRSGMQQINYQAQRATNSSVHENKLEAISNMIETENQNLERGNRALKILVTDESGKVVYKTKQAQEEQIDLHNTIRNAASFAINYSNGQDIFENTRKEFIAFHLLQ